MTVLVIDQGTSGTKAVVVGDEGEILSIAEASIRPDYLSNSGVEQDPIELLDSVLATGRRAVTEAGRPIDAVSVANQGETVLAWDPRDGRPLSRAIVWQDRRSETVCRLHENDRQWVAERTGLVLDPYFSAPKMAWVRANATTDGVVTTSDTWLIHQLTGEFVTDRTTASRSLLTNLDSTDWDDDLLALFELEDERLPRIAANDEIIGRTTAFGDETDVGGLIVDQQAALYAQGCLQPGTAKATFGTGVFLLANVGATPVRPTSGLTCSVAWNLRGSTTYCVDGQSYTAASAVRWLIELGVIGDAAELDTVAADDSAGVLFVPALAGLAAPWWRPEATAALTGMTLSTGRAQIVTAVLQGLAAQTAELVSAVDRDLSQPLNALRVDGGLTRSRRLMQVTADLTGLPVEVYPSSHATALGAAACARLACDDRLDLEDAITHPTDRLTYEPRWSADRADEFRSRWRTAVTANLEGER